MKQTSIVELEQNSHSNFDLNKAIESLENTAFRGSLEDNCDDDGGLDDMVSDNDVSSHVTPQRGRNMDLSQELPIGNSNAVPRTNSKSKENPQFSFSQVEDHQILGVKMSSSGD